MPVLKKYFEAAVLFVLKFTLAYSHTRRAFLKSKRKITFGFYLILVV